MEDSVLEKLRYPIGKFKAPEVYSTEYLKAAIAEIASFPKRLKEQVIHLTEEQLDTPYRQGGWTIRQVIHHCGDSHMNCYIRLKWALTEEIPIIKYYYEDRWAQLEDNLTMPIQPSLLLLEGLHYRLAYLMRSLNHTDLEKSFIHPEHDKEIQVQELIGLYAWHGNHHLAHISELMKLKNWQKF